MFRGGSERADDRREPGAAEPPRLSPPQPSPGPMKDINPPGIPSSCGILNLERMTTTITPERPVTTDSRASSASPARSVDGIFRSTEFHWVGNGFHVSTYFP